MLRFRLAQLFWVLLLVCSFMVVGNDRAEAEEALASWYGPGFDGLPTATGAAYDAGGLSTAHQTLPMGTELMVSYGGKSVPVTVSDRGPYTEDRELDLSQGAAQALGLIGPGVDWVQVECANGGIYPNCSAAITPTPAIDAPVQYAPVLQNPPLTQGAPVVDAPVQDPPLTQGAPVLQDGASDGMYLVQPGETSSGIAAELGTSMEQLTAYNNITDPNFISTGQALLY